VVVQKDGVKNVSVDVIVMHQSVLIVQMTYVTNVIVARTEMIFKHENFILDTENAGRSALYKDGKLEFLGDGYRAITILVRNCVNPEPVREKFHNQLTTREKPKFTKQNDLEVLRKQAEASIAQQQLTKKSKK
tara:strand:+ start:85 stop:483 length:399 start_codon:yes stop_codon:yes gene_type:complete